MLRAAERRLQARSRGRACVRHPYIGLRLRAREAFETGTLRALLEPWIAQRTQLQEVLYALAIALLRRGVLEVLQRFDAHRLALAGIRICISKCSGAPHV